MKRSSLLKVLISAASLVAVASAAPVHLRCEYRENPLGIDAPAPHLSWQSDSAERNWKQTAYQVLVASSNQLLQSDQPDVWDSGKIASDESVGISYKGPALESRKRYYWKVRVWDSAGRVSDSAEQASWEMGLLRPDDWQAKWISWNNPEDSADRAGIRWVWAQGQNPLATAPSTKVKFQTSVTSVRGPSIAGGPA